jgi:signal transduction histidine kinase
MRSVASTSGRHSTPLPANRGKPSPNERLDALHRMAGTITHDLNNLLGVILSANERLAGELPDGSEQQKLALLALEAAERSAELLRRSLSLAQDRQPEIDAVDGRAAIETVGRVARQAIAPGVQFDVALPPRTLQCAGDRTGLEMALFNLCLNAGQATPDGGRVSLGADETRLDLRAARRLGLAPGAYAVFTVRDTGKGMSPETLARATKPLFTTKAAGTGLGLSSVCDFAAEAGGALDLQSREGHGATAALYLPVAAAPRRAAAA